MYFMKKNHKKESIMALSKDHIDMVKMIPLKIGR